MPREFLFNNQLDCAALAELFDGDFDQAEVVFAGFMQHIPVFIEELHGFYSKNDIQGFKKELHKQKPVMYYVGLTGIQNEMQRMEDLCDLITDITELKAGFATLTKSIETWFPVIKAELARLQVYNAFRT